MKAAVAIFVAIFLGVGGYWYAQKDERFARVVLATVLKDAESAQIKNIKRVSDDVLCGQVNAKNSYGTYTGFSKFVVYRLADKDLVGLESDETEAIALRFKHFGNDC